MSSVASGDAGELLRRIRRQEISALDVVRECLAVIDVHDEKYGAFLRINPDAERDAAAIDRRLADGEDVGPLGGIPVAIKDNIHAAGLETSCASRILEGFRPTRDATAVGRLRAAGAVILGKTNMDEFGMGSSTENSAFGITRNPWDRDRVPGGSSGGSIVAVATGMAPIALGSDTGGSVRQPAAFCGVVGMKPTYGRVSRSGLVAYGSSLDQIGVAARSVGDCARTLESIAGPDPDDATSANEPVESYLEDCVADAAGLRFGLPREYVSGAGLDPEIAASLRGAARILEDAGGRVEEISLPHARYAIPAYYLLATSEASSNLARYDGVRYGARRDDGLGLRAMYLRTRGTGFGTEVKRRIMLGTYALSAGYYEAFYGKALRVRSRLRADFANRFGCGFDLILAPTTPTPAFRIGEKVDDPLAMYLSDIYTVTANLVGLPAISIPVGLTSSGLPIGVQLIGPEFGEPRLFRAATAIEFASERLAPPIPDSPASRPRGGTRGGTT